MLVFAQDRRARSVVVTTGDSFLSIALREFGSAAYGRMIAEHNELDYHAVLTPGQLVYIPLEAVSRADTAEVFFSKGKVIRYFAGATDQADTLSTGDHILAKDIIRTFAHAFVSLRFPSGTVINIQPDSLVQLINLDCLQRSVSCVVELSATKGSLNSNVTQRGSQPAQVIINTPHASAAVRGTIFDIDAGTDQILIGVTEGEVDVSAQGRSTGLVQGLGVKTRAGQASDSPVKLLPAPSLRRLPPRVTVEDILGWYPVSGAAGYRLALSRDAEGAATLYEVEETGVRHQIQLVDAGQYFIAVRAIDNTGFKGFVVRQPMVVAAVDDTLAAVELVLLEDGNDQILKAADVPVGAEGIEIQLSFSEDFLELGSVDVPLDGGVVFTPAAVVQYARARTLRGSSTTSRFGPVLELPVR